MIAVPLSVTPSRFTVMRSGILCLNGCPCDYHPDPDSPTRTGEVLTCSLHETTFVEIKVTKADALVPAARGYDKLDVVRAEHSVVKPCLDG